jgi:hypothetical protein
MESMPVCVRACAVLLLGLVLASAALADAYPTVDVCQLMANPDAFDGKMITVRVAIAIGFEDFEMVASQCRRRAANGIWLEYARGPKHQPTTWCCGEIRSHDPIALKMDHNFHELDRYLRATRKQEPEYDVTVTLSGRFDSAPAVLCPDGKSLCAKEGGFGHFGVYTSRLVIESVADVSAVKREKE